MTKEQLAEREFPYLTLKPKWATSCERAAFIKGLDELEGLAEWIHKNPHIVIMKDGYWYNPGVDLSYKELVNMYITEKYGSNDNSNKV